MWRFLHEFQQFLVCFALLPTCGVRSEHKIVRSMSSGYASALMPRVLQREMTRLIVVFQNADVVLKFKDKSEFHPVAFELDHPSHLGAGVTPDNV
jgi:hypothetical protein